MSKFPQPIQKIIMQLRKLPGVGSKTAERYAFSLLSWDSSSLEMLSHTIGSIQSQIKPCSTCGCLTGNSLCEFCDTTKRDSKLLCIVSSPKDIYPIEETHIFKGMYHVIGGMLSPIHGYSTEKINVEQIKKRIQQLEVTDVVLALDSTIEGDATSLFLREELQNCGVSVSRLAFGIPLGSSLDYVDSGTLTRAFLGRLPF